MFRWQATKPPLAFKMASPKANASPGASLQLSKGNVAKFNDESTVLYQFRCPVSSCKRVFWRRTEQYRPYAGCRDCKRRWKKQGSDPSTYPSRLERLEDHQMIGYAKFNCDECGNVFTNTRAMYGAEQPCRQCKTLLLPSTELRPPPPPRPPRIWSSDDYSYNRPRYLVTGRAPSHECSVCKTGGCKIENMAFSKRHVSSEGSTATISTIATHFLGEQRGGFVDPTLDSGVYEVLLKSKLVYRDPSEPFDCALSLAYGSGSQSVNPPPTIPE